MGIFKKTFLIAFTAIFSYWIIASLLFSYGQLLFHVVSALVGAAYVTKRLIEKKRLSKWLAIILWPILIILIYKATDYFGLFMNWTIYFMPLAQLWFFVRLFDVVLASLSIATIVSLGQKTALAFGKGQLIFHAATALVAATFLAKLLLQHRGRLKWLAIIVWPVLVAICYETISYWAIVINWTLDFLSGTDYWNYYRFADIVLISIAIAYSVVLWHKWWHPNDNYEHAKR